MVSTPAALQVRERHVDGPGGVGGQADERLVGAVRGVLQADADGHGPRWRRQHRELDAVAMAWVEQTVGKLIAQQRLPFTGIERVAGGGHGCVAGEPDGLYLRGHAAVLPREQHEALQASPVDVEAGVVGVRQRDRRRAVGGDETPFDQRLAVLVLYAQENVGAGSNVVTQIHLQRLEVTGGPVVAWVLACRIGVIRLAEHAGGARGVEIERQGEGTLVPQPHVDGRGIALDVVGGAVIGQRVVLKIADADPFVGEPHVEQDASQPADVLREPALVGAEFALPLAQLPLVEVGLQGPLVEKIAGGNLNDHENDEGKAEQQRNGDEQALDNVGVHGSLRQWLVVSG